MGSSRPSAFSLTTPGKLRLYSTRELLGRPRPKWLIEDIIPQGAVVGLYGAPGEGKSFVAGDIAMRVGTGLPWFGKEVKRGYAIYIAAEGGSGMVNRVGAWIHNQKLTPEDVRVAWLVESIAVNNDADDVDALLTRIDDEIQEVPTLIVIDTLARCFDGNENQQEDMGRFISGVDYMRMKYGATVIIVHHTNVGGIRERGNTAFRGAADTMISVRQDKETKLISVECDKQKDGLNFEPIELMLLGVPQWDSAIVAQSESTNNDRILDWLQVGPLHFSDMKARTMEQGSLMSYATLKRRLRELRENGQILNENGIYSLSE